MNFFGVWNVLEFSAVNEEGPSIEPWARVAFDLDDQFYVRTTKGNWLRFKIEIDDGKKAINLIGTDELVSSAHLTFTQPTVDELVISGEFNLSRVSYRLQKNADPKGLLQLRGFRWVTERPFER